MTTRAAGGPIRRPAAALAIVLAAALLGLALLGGAAWARGGGGEGGGGSAPAPRLPADFPASVPLPPGSLSGSTGSNGHWSVLLVVRGSAAHVQHSTKRFYLRAGFRSAGDAVVRRGAMRITILAAARDHSPRETNLTLAVSRRA
jgi:hypothetical protein